MDLRVQRPSAKRHRGYRTRDQPPTRKARRNGFGETGDLAPAIKNLQRVTVQVGVSGRVATFHGGDVARVHLQECQGGGLRCAARCLSCSTHSLPQVTSAGRNLITVFSSVNTLAKLFSRPACPLDSADCLALRSIGARAITCNCTARNFVITKVLFFSAFDSHHWQCAGIRWKWMCTSQAAARVPIRPRNRRKIICADVRIFALHKPICAEMRKRFAVAARPANASKPMVSPQKTRVVAGAGFHVHDRKRYFRAAASASAKASRSTACLVSVVQTSRASPC